MVTRGTLVGKKVTLTNPVNSVSGGENGGEKGA